MSGLAFILTGFAIVIGVLSLLWLVCIVVGRFFKVQDKPPVKASEPAADIAQVTVPSAHITVISAAVAAMMPGPHRIVRVFAPGHRAAGWVEQGRAQLSASHRVRWDWVTRAPGSSANTIRKDNHESEQ